MGKVCLGTTLSGTELLLVFLRLSYDFAMRPVSIDEELDGHVILADHLERIIIDLSRHQPGPPGLSEASGPVTR